MLTEGKVVIKIAEDLGKDGFIFGRDKGRRQNGKEMTQEIHNLELWICELIYIVSIGMRSVQKGHSPAPKVKI